MNRKRIIVIAGNFEEFNYYKREYPKNEQEKLIYAANAKSIMGIEAERVDCVGTYYKRKDYREVESLAAPRVR